VNHEELVAHCLAKPGATPDGPWQGSEAAELRHRYPGAASVMPYIGRHGWNTVAVDGTVPDDELLEVVDDSYAAVIARPPERLHPQTA
jgi:predicted DNA-binding protein (MmcQ/YjbR family)